jgi:chemotaxis protein CheZ
MSTDAEAGADRGAQDSDELQALFDSVAAVSLANAKSDAVTSVSGTDSAPVQDVISQIGQLTRKLHDALHELGYDRALEDAAQAIPEARDRLAYVANMTRQAAERVLSAIETAKPIQDRIQADSAMLAYDWQRVRKGELGVSDFKSLVERTHAFLASVSGHAQATNAQLMEIMLAQEFQDLTGQTINRVTAMVQDMEAQLLQLLVKNSPAPRREGAQARGLLNGPVVNPNVDSHVVTSQAQVDELLQSLGY